MKVISNATKGIMLLLPVFGQEPYLLKYRSNLHLNVRQ